MDNVFNWGILAVKVYRSNNKYRRHLFVTFVSHVYATLRQDLLLEGETASDHDFYGARVVFPLIRGGLLEETHLCMVDALRWSIIHAQKDCGTFIPLPWINDIAKCHEVRRESPRWRDYPLTGIYGLQPPFLLFLRLLETCLQRGLLTGETAAADFERLLTLLDHPKLPGLPTDWTLEAIAATHTPNSYQLSITSDSEASFVFLPKHRLLLMYMLYSRFPSPSSTTLPGREFPSNLERQLALHPAQAALIFRPRAMGTT